MNQRSALRVALGADGVSIYSSEIFGGTETSRVRDFLSRAFAVQEVENVELRRSAAFGRVRYGAVANPAQIWRKLSRALSTTESPANVAGPHGASAPLQDAGLVYLEGSSESPVRVTRIGEALSTWRLRGQKEGALSLWHPRLRNRRDLAFRLEEELAGIFGVEDFRASTL